MKARNSQSEHSGNQLLEMAEYAALGFSVAGSIATIIVTDLIKFAAPFMSLSLLLSFVNRRRMEQLVLQESVRVQSYVQQLAATETHQTSQPLVDLLALQQQVSHLQNQDENLQRSMEMMSQQFMGLATADKLYNVETALAQLSEQLSHLETHSGSAMPESGVDLSRLQAEIQAAVAPLQTRLERLQQHLGEGLNVAPVGADPAYLHAEVQASVAPLQAQLEQLQGQLQAMSAGQEAPATLNPEQLQSEVQATIAPLQAQLEQLQQQLEGIRPDTNISEQLQTLQTQFADLNQRMASVMNATPAIDVTRQVEQLVQQQVATLSQQLTPTDASPDQTEQVEQLRTQIEELRNQSQEALASLRSEVANLPHLMQESFSQQVGTMSQQVEPAQSEQIQELQQQVQQQIESLNVKVEEALKRVAHEIAGIPSWVERALQAQKSETTLGAPADSPAVTSATEDSFPPSPAEETPDWDSLLAELDIETKS